MFHKGEIFLTGDSNESGGYSIRFRYAHSSVFAHNDTPGEIVDNHIIHAFKRLVKLFNFFEAAWDNQVDRLFSRPYNQITVTQRHFKSVFVSSL